MSPFYVASLDIDTDDIANKVFNLRDKWELRSPEYPFYSIGKSSYMDNDPKIYYGEAQILNPILLENFAALYDVVLSFLSGRLAEPVTLAKDLAYPGFHIFDITEKYRNFQAGWHQDRSLKSLEIIGTDNSSFTVSIKLPVSGAGLDWIDKNHIPRHIAYKEKDIVWHNGLTSHRIAGFKDIIGGEYRITLQGHLVRRNGKMEAYW